MFQMPGINIPVLGVIENMAYFTPDELPDNKYYIFGKGGAAELAAEYDVPVLGQLPLFQSLVDEADTGTPGMVQQDGKLKAEFIQIAEKVAQQIAILNAK